MKTTHSWAIAAGVLCLTACAASAEIPPTVRAGAQTPAAAPTTTASNQMSLVVGEKKPIPARGIASYTLGVSGIADVKDSQDLGQIIVVGLRPGSTELLALLKGRQLLRYDITVYARDPQASGSGSNGSSSASSTRE